MAPAYGGYPLHVRTLTTKVLAPLQLSVSRKHGVLVGDAAASKLQQVLRGGNVRTIVSGPQPGEISGVDVNRHGDIAYTSSDYKTGKTGLTIRSHGKSKFVDLSAFEKKYNPDRKVPLRDDEHGQVRPRLPQGGPRGPAGRPTRASSTPTPMRSPRSRAAGWSRTRPATTCSSSTARVATSRSSPSCLRSRTSITAADVKSLGAPDCLMGVTYNFEPVPTDVEVGRHGALYISTLPGGPEAPGFSPAEVSTGSPATHHLRRLATGFNGATNLALTPSGRVLVAELFAGRMSTIAHGRPAPVINLPGVASLEFYCHALYAGLTGPMDAEGNPTGNGKVVKISVRW